MRSFLSALANKFARRRATSPTPDGLQPIRARGNRRNERLFIATCLAPAFVVLLVFVYEPIFESLRLSLFHTNLLDTGEFTGLQNYKDVLSDPLFRHALWNTLYFTVGSLATMLIGGLGIALLLARIDRGKVFFRTVVFLPYVIPYAAYALLWYWLFDAKYGFINYLLSVVHIPAIPWLHSSTWVIPSFIVMSTWKRVGFAAVLFLAALQSIPEELKEAASLDGAGWWRSHWHIVFPLLSPVALFVSAISVTASLQLFVEPYAMTQGGPGYSSVSIAYLLYTRGFSNLNMGQASAIAVMLFVIVLAAGAAVVRRFDRSFESS